MVLLASFAASTSKGCILAHERPFRSTQHRSWTPRAPRSTTCANYYKENHRNPVKAEGLASGHVGNGCRELRMTTYSVSSVVSIFRQRRARPGPCITARTVHHQDIAGSVSRLSARPPSYSPHDETAMQGSPEPHGEPPRASGSVTSTPALGTATVPPLAWEHLTLWMKRQLSSPSSYDVSQAVLPAENICSSCCKIISRTAQVSLDHANYTMLHNNAVRAKPARLSQLNTQQRRHSAPVFRSHRTTARSEQRHSPGTNTRTCEPG